MRRVSPGYLCLAFVAACGGGSISVNSDYDPLAGPKMSAYHTWNWLRPPVGTPPRADSAVQTLVERAVEARLAGLGYQKRDSSPEFRVGWHAGLDGPLDVTTLNNYYGYAWGRWFPGGGVAFGRGFRTEYEAGSLVLDVADSRAGELIWRGIGRDVFREKEKAGERERNVTDAVTRALAQFPPGTRVGVASAART
jgi:hypothetical protein